MNSMPGWWDWGYIYDNRRWYYIMQAACWFPAVIAYNFFDVTDGVHTKTLRIFAWCLGSNLADELFFNPIELGLNEIVFGLYIICEETGLNNRYLYPPIKGLCKRII